MKRGRSSLSGPELQKLRMEAICVDNAALLKRIAALEAENKRLREALFQVEAQLHYIAKPEEHYPSNVRSAWEEALAALEEAT